MDIQWPLVIFSLFAGAGGGLFAFIGISEILGIGKKARVPSSIIVLVLLVLGGCASVVHLGQPTNIMAAATNIFSFSGISVELIMLGINVVLAIVYLVCSRNESSGAKIVGIVGVITGVIMTFVVGNGYVIEAQAAWNTIALPFAYLGSGLACGGTLFAAVMVALKIEADELKKISLYVIGALVVQAVTFLAYGAQTGFAADALVYWAGAVVVGTALSLGCVVWMRKSTSLGYAACACAFVGGVCLRAVMWMLGTGFIDMFVIAGAHGVLGL